MKNEGIKNAKIANEISMDRIKSIKRNLLKKVND